MVNWVHFLFDLTSVKTLEKEYMYGIQRRCPNRKQDRNSRFGHQSLCSNNEYCLSFSKELIFTILVEDSSTVVTLRFYN